MILKIICKLDFKIDQLTQQIKIKKVQELILYSILQLNYVMNIISKPFILRLLIWLVQKDKKN
jgi:hypothetical protein